MHGRARGGVLLPRLLLALVLAGSAAPAQELPLWGELTPGPHAVGFRTHWEEDPAREYDVELPDGTRYGEGGSVPRPILVNTWYPAAVEPGARRMPHGGYFELEATSERLTRLSRALEAHALRAVREWVLGDHLEDEAELARLLDAPTACVRDAAPAPGRFPLVLYHSGYGSSYEDNSALCEYLASHGYVVVGSAWLSETEDSLDIDGKEGSGRDFAFLIRSLAGAPNVDVERVALIGHSGGAHAALAWQAEPTSAVDAVISLDTTQDYVSSLDPHWRHPRRMLENVEYETTPLLVVARPHALFATCDALVRAERTYLTFRDLDHEDYTSQGLLAAEVAARRARDRVSRATDASDAKEEAEELEARVQAVRRGFAQCSEYGRLFLDAHLRGDEGALAKLAVLHRTNPLGGARPHVDLVPAGASGPPPYDPDDPDEEEPPSPRQLLPLIAEHGAARTLEVLERARADHPEAPILHVQVGHAVLYDLVARGRADEAALLAPFFAGLHPTLAGLFRWYLEHSANETYTDYRTRVAVILGLLQGEAGSRAGDPESEARD